MNEQFQPPFGTFLPKSVVRPDNEDRADAFLVTKETRTLTEREKFHFCGFANFFFTRALLLSSPFFSAKQVTKETFPIGGKVRAVGRREEGKTEKT